MTSLLGIGISVGALAGLWTAASVELGLVTWVGFLAWACFFAAGGGTTGLAKGLSANLSGVAWAWLVAQVLALATGTWVLALAVAVIGFAMCVQAAWPVLSFIPGAFVGAAAFFGTGFDLVGTAVALVLGAGLGWLSAQLGERLQHAFDHRGAVRTGGDAPAAA